MLWPEPIIGPWMKNKCSIWNFSEIRIRPERDILGAFHGNLTEDIEIVLTV